MKNFTLSLVLLLAGVTALWAQTTIYTQNFSSAGLPTGWQNVDNTPNNAGKWTRKTSAHSFVSTTASNGFWIFDSDAYGNDNKAENADLISAAINCSANSFVALQFEHYFQQYSTSSGTVSVSTDGTNWTQVYSVTQTSGNPEVVVLDISTVAAYQPTVYLKFNYTGDYDYWWAVDDIKLFQPDPLDISVETITVNKYVGLGNRTITGVVKNNGATAITSFDLSYTDNGGTPVYQSFSGLYIAPFQTYNFSFNQPISMPVAALHNVSVTAYAPNNGNETNVTNNTLAKAITSLSGLPVKNVLIEEFTTAPCQYCPRGTTEINKILANHTNVIAAALHAGFGTDAMTIPDHSTVASAYTSGAPSACIDRVFFSGEEEVAVSTNVWESYCVQQKSTVTPVSIIADNVYNSATRELTVNASARFYGPINDNFRINCYIIEDSVTGTGSGYNQVNYYNTQSSSEWYQKGNPIIGFAHRHVCRQMLGGAWGSTGVITSPTTDGGLYSKQYTYTLPANWNDSRIKIVVLVQEYATSTTNRQILNALQIHLNDADSTFVNSSAPSAVTEVSSKLASVSLYPNPATDVVNLEYSINNTTTVSFEVYNIIGQSIQVIKPSELAQGDYRTTINTSDFKNGVYFVAVKENNKTVNTLKFVVNK
ncbi:MAG: Omp28-related outer membrane protein [Chitinophagales bacterium]|nr:Omp28-related outer membrane protein [Chitinophagales bacterium]